MTSIHARVPGNLRQAVDAAKTRGEEDRPSPTSQTEVSVLESRMDRRQVPTLLRRKLSSHVWRPSPLPLVRAPEVDGDPELSDDEEDHDPSKENDPSQSPSPVMQSPRSPRKNVLGKRPLSELPTPTEPEEDMTESEKNVAVNQLREFPFGPPKKSPKLAVMFGGANAFGRLRDEWDGLGEISSSNTVVAASSEEEKENVEQKVLDDPSKIIKVAIRPFSTSDSATLRPTLRKVSNLGSSKGKQQPRVGIRRL